LVTELVKLAGEDLRRSWRLSLNKLCLSELLQKVEVGNVHRGHEAQDPLGLGLSLGVKALEVYLWICWN